MKQILQRIAFFSFLGCITLIGLAAGSTNPHLKCEQEWKQGFVKKTVAQESMVEANTHDHSYELNFAGKVFKYFID